MSRPSAYLAGPITGLPWDLITGWRNYVKQEFALVDIDAFSPLRGKLYLANETSISDSYDNHVMSTQRGILARDHFDATHRDLLFVNLLETERVSIGTVMEIAWAHEAGVPIVLALTERNANGTKNPHDHSMIREACPLMVPTLKEAIEISKHMLLP
jgi:hypothetical protein